jgi:regulator of replication initiation timing
MAQEFYRLFGYGDDETSISTIDPDGIALAAIQELQRQNAKLQSENAKLQVHNSALEERVARIEIQLQQLCGQGSSSIKQVSFTHTIR